MDDHVLKVNINSYEIFTYENYLKPIVLIFTKRRKTGLLLLSIA